MYQICQCAQTAVRMFRGQRHAAHTPYLTHARVGNQVCLASRARRALAGSPARATPTRNSHTHVCVFGGASRTPVAEGGGALWKARRSISPREKSGEKSSVGSAQRGGSALDSALQVAIVAVRERSYLERVGDRCRSLAIRLSQRNSTHMLGASPFTA